MANVFRTVGRVFDLSSKVDEGTGLCIIGDASDGLVGTFSVHLVNVSGLAASIVVKARTRIPQANDDNVAFQPIPYLKLFLNGVVANSTFDTVPLTTDSIILIPATGLEIALDVTFTSGQGRIYWSPLKGAAA